MTFPFPGQVPCRHAAPLSHTFSSMFHVCCTKKEKEETQTCHASRQSMPIDSRIPIVFNPSKCLCVSVCGIHTVKILPRRCWVNALLAKCFAFLKKVKAWYTLNKRGRSQTKQFHWRFLKKWGIPAMTLQLVACPEWKHVMMVGLEKTLPKKPSKILSSDAISIVFTNNWQFLGNIAHHIFVVQCSVEPRSQVSMTDMQLTGQEAQTSQP